MAISLAVARKNAACDGIVARANSGFLRIYAGSVPANADASLGAASLLGTCGFGATAFGAASSGTATANANAISNDTAADATGTATFFRVVESDGTTIAWQGTVSASGGGGDLILTPAAVVAGVQIAITSLTFTVP
jgi:hypothetical protein